MSTARACRDLAATLHITEKAVESQLTRARKAFRVTFLAWHTIYAWNFLENESLVISLSCPETMNP